MQVWRADKKGTEWFAKSTIRETLASGPLETIEQALADTILRRTGHYWIVFCGKDLEILRQQAKLSFETDTAIEDTLTIIAHDILEKVGASTITKISQTEIHTHSPNTTPVGTKNRRWALEIHSN